MVVMVLALHSCAKYRRGTHVRIVLPSWLTFWRRWLFRSKIVIDCHQVFLPNGEFRSVKYGPNSDLKSIVETVIRRMRANTNTSTKYFGLKYEDTNSGEFFWLNLALTMQEVKLKFQKVMLTISFILLLCNKSNEVVYSKFEMK